ncbi:MAG: hypothetical protein JSV20_09685 [Candidatus Bathyarchaeota archaeon]|nr:MAG: hypothetical protein JSV20_09685 [Candidatus Bathyarchaeota archaeon]
MWEEEPTPEEEEKIIEKVAQFVVDRGLKLPAGILLTGFLPYSFIGGQLGRFFLSPYLYALGNFGESGSRLMATFEKRENVKKLQERIEQLEIAYTLLEDNMKKEKDGKQKAKKEGILARLRNLFWQ